MQLIVNGSGSAFLETCRDIMPVLTGATTPGFSSEEMCAIWKVSGRYTNSMYKARLQTRQGVA